MKKTLFLIPVSETVELLRKLINAKDGTYKQDWAVFSGRFNDDESGFMGIWSENDNISKTIAGESVRKLNLTWISVEIDTSSETWKIRFKDIPEVYTGNVSELKGNIRKPYESILELSSDNIDFSINTLMLNDFLVSRNWINGKTCEEQTAELYRHIQRGGTVDL